MYITNDPNRSDGFGAQFQNIVWLIVFAGLNGYTFAYSDIKSIEHNYNNDPEYINSLIKFTTIKEQFSEITTIDTAINVDMHFLYRTIANEFDLYFTSESFIQFKNHFRKDKRTPFLKDTLNIVIHYRKNNMHDNNSGRHYMNNTDIIRIIEYFNNMYQRSDAVYYHICSQGDSNEYLDITEKFKDTRIIYHLNENLTDTFMYMIFADILVTANSSLSYVAALLSSAIVYYKIIPADNHPPLKSWKIVDTLILN
jgi:hypothetical protein